MRVESSSCWRRALLAPAAIALAACGGGGGGSVSSSPPPAAGANVATLTVDGGPVVNGAPIGTVNQSYVQVTICAPGSTTNCQTLKHVWVDTGSSGLRLIAPSLTVTLPASTDTSGNVIANCAQFISSYSWGAVRQADVTIAGEFASAVPVQVIGDAAVPAAPTSCSSAGTPLNTAAQLGADGLIGIGLFKQDCGTFCESGTPAGFYYTCPGGTTANCAPINMAANLQLQNVVSKFAADNNGTLVQLPALGAGGGSTATGSLIFGINTQSNNSLSGMVFAADANGFIHSTTTYGDLQEPASYIDSGSNGWFFNDPGVNQCTSGTPPAPTGFYCPTSALSLQATMLPSNSATGFTYSFSVVDITTLPGNAFNNVGGPSGTCNNASTNPAMWCTFDWGLTFFYGRNVFTAIEGTTIGGNATPFFAASTP